MVAYQMMEELNAFTNGSLVCKCTDKGLKWRGFLIPVFLQNKSATGRPECYTQQ
ncbi:unnamed protein product [Prunus brigantina]